MVTVVVAVHAMQMKKMSAVILFVALVVTACGGDATPTGTVVLDESFEADADGPLDGTEQSEHELTLVGGARVSVALSVGRTARGRYVRHASVTVTDASGAQISATLLGDPVNRGTESTVLHERMIRVREARTGLTGRSSNETNIAVRGDGTAVVQ